MVKKDVDSKGKEDVLETPDTNDDAGKPEVVPVSELRKLQAAKDKEVAAALNEARLLRESQAVMQRQLEALESTIADPEARKKLADQRIQAELDTLRKERSVHRLVRQIAADYEVPMDALESAVDESSAVKLALDWLKNAAKQVKADVDEQKRQEAIATKEKEGALEVAEGTGTAPGTAPKSDALTTRTLDFKTRIAEAYKKGDKKAAKALQNEWFKGNVKGPEKPVKPVV